MHKIKNPCTNQRSGAALVLVLALVLLISALLFQSQWMARTAAQNAERINREARLRADSLEALVQSLQRLADDEDLTVDTLEDAWGEPQEITFPSGSAHVMTIRDLHRYVDLNNLSLPPTGGARRPPAQIILDAMSLSGRFAAIEEVEAMKDWMDEDREGGREARYYERLEAGYVPPNRQALSWGELLWIEGNTREAWVPTRITGLNREFETGLLDLLTVIPVDRAGPMQINLNTASPQVLQSVLGLGQEELVTAFVALRTRRPLRSVEELAAVFPDLEVLQAIREYVSVNSRYFSIRIHSYLEGMSLRGRCLVEREDDGTVEILRWVM